MRYLKLSNSPLLAFVRDVDYERCAKLTWCLWGKGNQIRTWFEGRPVGLPNFIMGTELMYDHIDRNFLNNQRENFRPCSYSQNAVNRAKRKGTSSIYKGVCYMKARNKWVTYITIDYKRIHLGCFLTEIKAARAYDKKAQELFGEFAVLNFPLEVKL